MDKYLLKKHEIETMLNIDKTHFLNQNAVRTNKSLGDETGISGFGFHLIEVPPGKESTEFHLHYYENECLYVIFGNALAIIGNEEFPISEGDFIGYRAGGLPHKVVNNSEYPFRAIVVGQRLEHDLVEYPEQKKRLYRNKGQKWELVEIDQIQHPNRS